MKGCWPSSRWPTRGPGSQDERCQNRRPRHDPRRRRRPRAGARRRRSARRPPDGAPGPGPGRGPARRPVRRGQRPGGRRPTASRFDLAAVQGLLAVQRLDGWLLADDGVTNPIARELVNPDGTPQRRWFYLIPAEGEPMALVHASEVGDFARVPGQEDRVHGLPRPGQGPARDPQGQAADRDGVLAEGRAAVDLAHRRRHPRAGPQPRRPGPRLRGPGRVHQGAVGPRRPQGPLRRGPPPHRAAQGGAGLRRQAGSAPASRSPSTTSSAAS